jgi:hypothetical protein
MGVKFLAEVSELIVLLLLTSVENPAQSGLPADSGRGYAPLHAMNSRLGNR